VIRYEVVVTETARLAIEQQARYIAFDVGQPANALAWLHGVSLAVESLELAPRRAHVAEEDEYVQYEVRQYVVGSHLLLLTIDDDARTVTIVGLRHGHRRPRPSDPADADE